MWLAPHDAHVAGVQIKHTSLVPEGAQVRTAGELMVKPDGAVNLNTNSGHFMLMGVPPEEVPLWFAAITETILNGGLAPSKISPEFGVLAD